ncbi:RHS repeat domain-containing protein [Pelomonas sp. BJYL3]|uniref:RHS repeat domain-containing protein n=1 Tax=Pelomonas sp. BJYL3 TaxID=2976697 RepID=UPI0022B5A4B5|nr:RHS repeat domain-containing protein [Pelomonas sp. BJYL3]
MLLLAGLASLPGLVTAQSNLGLNVSTPNGYATLRRDDLVVMTTTGPVRWSRTWDGQEWKFNPHWESLSQSWKNLTGSQTSDTTPPVAGGSGTAGGASGGASGGSAVTSSGDPSSKCWVWVDEDWQPTPGTVLVGGAPANAPMLPERTQPFNRIIGQATEEAKVDYPPPVRVNIDYANYCMGSQWSSGMPRAVDLEGVRRVNELYLGEGGRYSFDNRTVLEKRPVRQLPSRSSDELDTALAGGVYPTTTEDNAKGYHWQDRAGDWVDYNTQGQIVAIGDRNNNTLWLLRDQTGQLRAVVDANGHVVFTIHYDKGLVSEVRDYPVPGLARDLPPRKVQYRYDSSNRLTEVVDARGNVLGYGYDSNNRLASLKDQEGRVERVEYLGETVAKHIAADGAETAYEFDYDDVHKLFTSKIVAPETSAGRTVEYLTHNRVGKLVRMEVNGRLELEVRSDLGTRTEFTRNARGFVTAVSRNEFEQPVRIEKPDGSVQLHKYSPVHLQRLESTDELGVRTVLGYDAKGNLLKVTEAAGLPEERVTELERDALGQLRRITRKGRTEFNGVVTPDASTSVEYDSLGQIRKTIDPEGGERLYVYNRAGHLIQFTDPRGQVTRYEVDAHGNLLKAVSPTP